MNLKSIWNPQTSYGLRGKTYLNGQTLRYLKGPATMKEFYKTMDLTEYTLGYLIDKAMVEVKEGTLGTNGEILSTTKVSRNKRASFRGI